MIHLPNRRERDRKRIRELYDLVTVGVSNGLSCTPGDERSRDLEFWKKRNELFDWFAQCVVNISYGLPYESERSVLKKIAEEGYHPGYD